MTATDSILFRGDLVERACKMLTTLYPADLTSAELAGLVAVLSPAYARFLDQPPKTAVPGRRRLHAVRSQKPKGAC